VVCPLWPAREGSGELTEGAGLQAGGALSLHMIQVLTSVCVSSVCQHPPCDRCIMLCADHGPCVSGAHNAIVTSRAGKDLVSCLVSGLLTIGPRFGGAIDDAARCVVVTAHTLRCLVCML
jgi:citrate synthase